MFIFGLILPIFLIDLTPCVAQEITPEQAVKLLKEAIEAADKAVDLYDKVFDRILPWNELNATLSNLDQYRDEYSKESGKLVGEVKTLVLNGLDSYFEATRSIFEWCDLAEKLLNIYLTILNQNSESTTEAEKQIILNVLEDGLKKMEVAQKSLIESSKSFNNVSGRLSDLHTRLSNDFDKSSEYYKSQVNRIREIAYSSAGVGVIAGPLGLLISYSVAAGVVEGKYIPELNAKMDSIKIFYENTKEQVDKATNEIVTTKDLLQEEYKHVGELRVQTKETYTLIPLGGIRDIIKESVNKLIARCIEFQERHGKEKTAVKLYLYYN